MYGNAPISLITGVPGWLTNDEETALVSLAKLVEDGVIINIGVEFGRSVAALAQGESPVFGYDIRLLAETPKNILEAGLDKEKVILQELPSVEAATFWKPKSVRMIFIDGDHSYAGVRADIEAWRGLLIPNGIIAFHDCACPTNKTPHPLHHEVMAAVNEEIQAQAQNLELLNMVDTLMVFRQINPFGSTNRPAAESPKSSPEEIPAPKARAKRGKK